jgi:hypothetical protein
VIPSTHCDVWRVRTRDGERTCLADSESAVSQQRPDNQGSMSCRDVVGRRCPASLSDCVSKPLACVSLLWSIVGSPQHASPGRQAGAAAEACRRNSKVAGSVEDGDGREKAHWRRRGSGTKSDTLSRLSLIQAVWRVGRILGGRVWLRYTHGNSQAWRRINGAPELRARKQGFDKSSRNIGCRDPWILMSKQSAGRHHQNQFRLTDRLVCPASRSYWFAAGSHRHTLSLRA